MTRANTRDAVVYSLVGELMGLDAVTRDDAIAAAAQGYIDEHLAQGGTIAE